MVADKTVVDTVVEVLGNKYHVVAFEVVDIRENCWCGASRMVVVVVLVGL